MTSKNPIEVELGNNANATVVAGASITLHGVKANILVESSVLKYSNGRPQLVLIESETAPCCMHQDCVDHPELGIECRRARSANGDMSNELRYSRTFKVGDLAAHDVHNLSFYGPIVSITAKTVVIKHASNDGSTRRLSTKEFNTKNWDFIATEAEMKNSDEMMYL